MSKRPKNRSLPKTGHIITSAVFLTLVFGVAIAGAVSPDREFSEMENRPLKKFPQFSAERLIKGDYTSDIEQYMSDQIFMKDELVTLKTAADRTLGKTYMNGVFLAEDGYYIQDFHENRSLEDTNIGCLNTFAEGLDENIPVSFLLAPNASYVLKDKLPANNDCEDQDDAAGHIREMLSDRITLAYPAEELKAGGAECYYRTDHHWTAQGAAVGYQALCETMGLPAAEGYMRSFEELPDFYGTLYSKAPAAWAVSDTIQLVNYDKSDITVKYVSPHGDHTPPEECTDVDGIPTKQGLFAEAPRTTKDKYATIMGGNFSLCEIETNGALDENVLILKDSYANAMLPDLCTQFKHISLIDLRYYHIEEESVSEYVKSHNIDRVIFIYNVDFLNSDNNFVWLE